MNCDTTILHHHQIPCDFTNGSCSCRPWDVSTTHQHTCRIVFNESIIDNGEGVGGGNVSVAASDCDDRSTLAIGLHNFCLVDRHRQRLMIQDVE